MDQHDIEIYGAYDTFYSLKKKRKKKKNPNTLVFNLGDGGN